MPPMKISGVDRCGCLIQSARLESSDLRYNTTITTTSANVDAIVAFNLPYDSLSTSYHNRMWLWTRANPIRLGRVPVLYLFLRVLSLPFSSLSQLSSLFPTSVFLSLSFAFPPSSFIPVLSALMTVLLSRESLPRERFAIEGCSYRFPGVFRPFNPASFLAFAPSSMPAQHLILNELESGTNSRKYQWKIDLIEQFHVMAHWNVSWRIYYLTSQIRYCRIFLNINSVVIKFDTNAKLIGANKWQFVEERLSQTRVS